MVEGGVRSICALVPDPANTTPRQRFRIEQWIPLLQAHGIRVDPVPSADSPLMALLYEPGRAIAKSPALTAAFARRFATVASVGKYDVVLVQRLKRLLQGPELS